VHGITIIMSCNSSYSSFIFGYILGCLCYNRIKLNIEHHFMYIDPFLGDTYKNIVFEIMKSFMVQNHFMRALELLVHNFSRQFISHEESG